MQTLNVGAGRTDAEYKAAEEQRRADLRAESQDDANYFYWAAGVAALGSGLLPVNLNILATIGVVDYLRLYAKSLGPAAVYGAAIAWMAALLALGFAASRGHRWAFLAGMVLYACDMIVLMMTFSIWAFGVHAFFVFRWFQGQKALKNLNEAIVSTT